MSSEESMDTSPDDEESKQDAIKKPNVIKDIVQKFSLAKKFGKSEKKESEIQSPILKIEEEAFDEEHNEGILDDVEYNVGSSLDKAQLFIEDFQKSKFEI